MSIRASVRALARYHFTPRASTVKLDQNEAPVDLPQGIRDAAMERLRSAAWHRYPELHPRTLEEAIAERYDWDPDGVVVTNGSNVLLQALVIVAGIGQTVLTVTPTFAVYGMQARLLGAELIELPLEGDGFALPVEGLRDAMALRRGIAFLADPAAPTGNVHARRDLEAVLRAASDDWLVVLDEAYGEFAGTDHRDLVREHPQAVSVRTFSKAFGLAGVRIGYALTSPDLAAEIRKGLLPFSFSSVQAAVAMAALQHPAYLEERVAIAQRERDRLVDGLTSLPGVEPLPSRTNFVLFRVSDAEAVYRGLLEHDIAVRRQDHLAGLEGCLRVTAGTSGETDAFLEALESVMRAEVVGG